MLRWAPKKVLYKLEPPESAKAPTAVAVLQTSCRAGLCTGNLGTGQDIEQILGAPWWDISRWAFAGFPIVLQTRSRRRQALCCTLILRKGLIKRTRPVACAVACGSDHWQIVLSTSESVFLRTCWNASSACAASFRYSDPAAATDRASAAESRQSELAGRQRRQQQPSNCDGHFRVRCT